MNSEQAVVEESLEWMMLEGSYGRVGRPPPWVVSREMGHGGRSLVDRVYGHLGDVRHRSEMVEFRVEQHRERLARSAKNTAHLSL